MKKTDLPKFSALWKSTAEAFGRTLSDAGATMVFKYLARFEYSEIDRALCRLMNTTKFMPVPADIVRMIEGDSEGRPMLAWSKVDTAVRSPGNNATVVFDDSIIMSIIEDTGGWIRLGKLDEQDLKFYGIDFQKRYRAYQSKPPTRHPSKLIGIEEQINRVEYPSFIPEPRLIGDPKKAAAILEAGVMRELPHRPLSAAQGKAKIMSLVQSLGADDEAV